MTGEIAAAGDIATGALIGRAIEPRAGEGDAHVAEGMCLNCGTALIGRFCHACGQTGHIHYTLASMGHDLLHGVFHFEGKIWHTLPMLAWRPGELTRRYIAGERARFVSPLAIFLFSVFLMFAVVAELPGWNLGGSNFLNEHGVTTASRAIAGGRAKADAQIANLDRRLAQERAKADPDPTDIRDIERDLAEAHEDEANLARAASFIPKLRADVSKRSTEPESWFEQHYRDAKGNPSLFLYKIKSSAYKYSWALIPISLPFIWLLFPFRRDVGMYHHAVFATYSLTFMSLLVTVLAVLGAAHFPAPVIVFSALLIPPFHIYRQLKGAYRLGRPGALWRTFWMLVFALFTASAFFLLMLYLGVAD